MLKYILSSFFLLSCSLGWSQDICLTSLIQVEESSELLSLDEYWEIETLLKNLGDTSFKAIYSANSPKALEVASLLSDAYNCPIIIDNRIRKILPKTLFKRIGELRTFGAMVHTSHVDEEVLIISDESFINFVGKYTEGGFKKIQNFCHLKVAFDGESPSIPH